MMQASPLTPLKLVRLERRALRYEVAKKIGVADRTLARWEEGENSPPLNEAVKLAEIYGVTLEQLAGRQPLDQAV